MRGLRSMRDVEHVQPRCKNLGSNGQIENGVALRQDPKIQKGPGYDAYAFWAGRSDGGHRISEDRRFVRRPDTQIDSRSGIISASIDIKKAARIEAAFSLFRLRSKLITFCPSKEIPKRVRSPPRSGSSVPASDAQILLRPRPTLSGLCSAVP